MRILIINQYAGGPGYGMEYRPYHLAKEWRRLGHDVTIVGGTYSHLRLRNPRSGRTLVPEMVDGVQVLWLPTPAYRGNGLARARNILVFATRLLAASSRLAQQYHPDVVITSSTQPLDIYGGRRIAKLAGARLVHEVHDLWPLTLIELAGLSRWHPFVLLLQAAENHAYRRADRVVSMLPAALPYMEKHGLVPERFVYVPNGVVVEDWARPEALPTAHAETLSLIKATDALIVGYAGGFALSNDLESLLSSLDHIVRPDIHLVLVGDGEYLQGLKSRYKSDRIRFLPPITKAAIPSLLGWFDICYFGFKRSPLYRFGVNPNKMFDYMMAARPIIAGMEAPNDPVTDSGAGITIAPGDPNVVAEAIDRLAAEPTEIRRTRGEMGRRYVIENYDYRVLAIRFLDGLN